MLRHLTSVELARNAAGVQTDRLAALASHVIGQRRWAVGRHQQAATARRKHNILGCAGCLFLDACLHALNAQLLTHKAGAEQEHTDRDQIYVDTDNSMGTAADLCKAGCCNGQ